MKITRLVVSAALLGAGIAVVRCQRLELATLAARQDELTAAVRQTDDSMQVERRDHDIRAHLSALDAPVAPHVPEAPPPPHPVAPESPPAAPPAPASYLTHLDDSFAEERGDAAWSSRATATAASRLAAAGGGEPRSLECRTSMCRLVTEDTGRDEAWRQIHAILGNPGDEVWSGAYFSRAEEAVNGRTERVTYLFRSGTLLPRASAD